jgi:pyruvate formate lyase activating enzyme
MKGLIFDIKRFAIHDGPGIRTTIFLKGCPLRCWWCHNPESCDVKAEPDKKHIKLDGRHFEQNNTIGKQMSVADVMKVIDKEAVFYDESNGGVTLSGGEPLLQNNFALALLEACKQNGYHTAVDTCGHVKTEILADVMKVCDLFLFDIKHLNSEAHRKYTGLGNELILKNLCFLVKAGKHVIIRIPVIPGINDSDSHFRELNDFLLETGGIDEVHLLPYHSIAAGKYNRLGKPNALAHLKDMKKESLLPAKQKFEQNGFKVKIGG